MVGIPGAPAASLRSNFLRIKRALLWDELLESPNFQTTLRPQRVKRPYEQFSSDFAPLQRSSERTFKGRDMSRIFGTCPGNAGLLPKLGTAASANGVSAPYVTGENCSARSSRMKRPKARSLRMPSERSSADSAILSLQRTRSAKLIAQRRLQQRRDGGLRSPHGS